MPRISVVSSWFRKGGLDLLFAGLAGQTYEDWELILVDHRYVKRHERVAELAAAHGIGDKVVHVPEHRCDWYWHSAAGYQTGYLLAEGEFVAHHIDWAFATPRWLEAHVEAHDVSARPRLVLGPTQNRVIPPERVGLTPPPGKTREQVLADIVTGEFVRGYQASTHSPVEGFFDELHGLDEPFQPAHLLRFRPQQWPHMDMKLHLDRQPLDHTYFHAKNCSLPRRMLDDTWGIDETFDRGRGPWDNELAFRYNAWGAEIWLEPSALIEAPNPRWYLRTMPWGAMLDHPIPGRWSYQDGVDYQDRRYVEMRLGGEPKANNAYDFQRRRGELLAWKRGARNLATWPGWGPEIETSRVAAPKGAVAPLWPHATWPTAAPPCLSRPDSEDPTRR